MILTNSLPEPPKFKGHTLYLGSHAGTAVDHLNAADISKGLKINAYFIYVGTVISDYATYKYLHQP